MCVLPWTHLEIDVNGSASPCCLYKGEIPNHKVYETSLNSIHNSSFMDDLRKEFKQGKRPAGCQNCWREEDAGKVSKRMNSIYKMSKSLKNWSPESKPELKFIDFKLGNVCNLKCRICGSWSSSKWAQEEMEQNLIWHKRPNLTAKKHLDEGGWPKKFPKFFEDVKEVLQNVQFFEFSGGEPFMIQKHFDILRHCVEKGYSKHQDIHYNTNGTQLPDKEIFELWAKFKRVEIAFSIDDVEKPYEYQRYGANWEEVNYNLNKFKEMAPASVDFQICSTINIFNVFHLDRLLHWVKEFKPKFFYVNTCFEPLHFNIQSLPKSVKTIITEKFSNLVEFRSIIDFMNKEDKDERVLSNWRQKIIRITDKYRGENFAEVFPTLNKQLKIYKTND